MRWLRRALLAGALLLLLLFAALALVLGTGPGLRWAWSLAEALAPVELSAAEVRGRLLGALEIRGLQVGAPGARVRVGTLALDWAPAALLGGTLHVRRLAAEDVHVQARPGAAPQEEPDGPPGLPEAVALPLDVILGELRVTELRVGEPGGSPLLREGRLAARFVDGRLTLEALSLTAPHASLEAEGSLTARAAYPLTLEARWRAKPPGLAPVAGDLALEGALGETLRLEHRLTGAGTLLLTGMVAEPLTAPALDLELTAREVDPRRLDATLPSVPVEGGLTLTGTPDALRLQGAVDLVAPGAGPLALAVDATGGMDGVRVQRLAVRPAAGGEALLQGTVDLAGETPTADLRLAWTDLAWPLEGAPLVQTPSGRLELSGALEAYALSLDARVGGPGLPDTGVEVDARGDLESATVDAATLSLLEGRVQVEGEVGWAPRPRWKARVRLDELNPGARWDAWPGRLAGRVDTEGSLTGAGLEARAALDPVAGTLRGYPVRATGAVRLAGGTLTLDDLALASGEVELTADGAIGERLDLRWQLDAPSLAALAPGAQGSLDGGGTVGGTPEAPEIRARLEGDGLAWQDSRVEHLELTADVAGRERLLLDLAARGVEAGGTAVERLSVEAEGSLGAHRIRMDGTGLGGELDLALAGGLEAGTRWAGRLMAARLEHPVTGAWRLAEPGPLALAAGEAQAGPWCLTAGGERICLEAGGATESGWQGALEVRALDLGRLNERLPPDVVLAGRLEADASAALGADGAATGSLRVAVPEGELRYVLVEGEAEQAERLAFGGTRLEGSLDAGGLSATAALPLDPGGTLSARLALPGWQPAAGLPPAQSLRGGLEGRVALPEALEALVPALADVEGAVDMDLGLAGTMGEPRVDGSLRLVDASVLAPAAGIHLEDIGAEVRSAGLDALGFTLRARSGEGEATVEGSVALDPAAGFPVEARIRGERFLAADLQEYRALVSPDLALRRTGERVTLRGEVRVPEARIAPESLPEGAVAPSDDVRVVRGGEPVEEAAPVAVEADVTVALGDDVRLDAFGLEARLAGRVRVRQPPRGIATASGQIRVEEGTYQAYGQDLTLSRGRLFYAGGPVENPGLDLRAERTVGDVVAGVQVSGTASNPQVSLYSEPPMEDAAVLSYLVLGRAPGEGGGGLSSQAVTRALALTGGGRVLEDLRDTLGFSELGLQEGETLAETSLVVGRQLGPGLYARLIAGALESTSILQLRYDLTKNLQLQTETGGRQGVDLFWTIER